MDNSSGHRSISYLEFEPWIAFCSLQELLVQRNLFQSHSERSAALWCLCWKQQCLQIARSQGSRLGSKAHTSLKCCRDDTSILSLCCSLESSAIPIWVIDAWSKSPGCLEEWRGHSNFSELLYQLFTELEVNRSFSCYVIAAMLEDDNKRFLISFYC